MKGLVRGLTNLDPKHLMSILCRLEQSRTNAVLQVQRVASATNPRHFQPAGNGGRRAAHSSQHPHPLRSQAPHNGPAPQTYPAAAASPTGDT